MRMDKLLLNIIEKASIGIILIDEDQKIVLWNGWLSSYFGLEGDWVTSKKIYEIFPTYAKSLYQEIIKNTLLLGQKRICTGSLHKELYKNTSIFQYHDKNKLNTQFESIDFMGQKFLMIQIIDISAHQLKISKMKDFIKKLETVYEEVKLAEKRNRALAIHDPLTRLPNRLLFEERLQSSIHLATRNGHIFAVMFVDLDGFKNINDSYGHKLGDKVLEKVAHHLKNSVRKIDTVARIGGDEFALILNQITEENHIHIVAEKIKNAIKKPIVIEEKEFLLTSSIGISLFPKDGQDSETLIDTADKAMCKIKKYTKDGYFL
jgi:diguanylate cyclase